MPVPSPIKMLRDLFSKKRVLSNNNNSNIINNKKSASCFDISEPSDVVHNLHIDMHEADTIVSTLNHLNNNIQDKQAFLEKFDKRKSFNSKKPR